VSIHAEKGESVSDSDDTKSTFEIIAQSPHAWLMAAKQLKKAADLIRQELTKILAVYPR
jgi:DNA transposition AAA+ family ATPase